MPIFVSTDLGYSCHCLGWLAGGLSKTGKAYFLPPFFQDPLSRRTRSQAGNATKKSLFFSLPFLPLVPCNKERRRNQAKGLMLLLSSAGSSEEESPLFCAKNEPKPFFLSLSPFFSFFSQDRKLRGRWLSCDPDKLEVPRPETG